MSPDPRGIAPDDSLLLAAWAATLGSTASNAAPTRVSTAGRALLERWSEPQRAYHTRTHLTEMLAALDLLATTDPMEPGALTVAQLATWFHDAVYDPTASDNETRSAALASTELRALGLDAAVVDEVAALVRATADHTDMAATAAGRAVHDADLWVLAAPAARFDEYCLQVREEYAFVPDAAYGQGRRAVLLPFLEADPLYLTDGAAPWHEAARANLRRELDRLAVAQDRA